LVTGWSLVQSFCVHVSNGLLFQMFDDHTRYLNIYGSQLKVTYKHGTIFEEYVIDSQPFLFERWLSCTVFLTAVFLHLGLQHHHTHTLALLCFVLAILALIKLHTKVKKGTIYQYQQLE
jgi:L-asparagine transporter-like permease